MSRAARQAARGRGRRGEWLAALWLRLKGFRILARGLRTPAGEVDLIARRGRLLIVVEVKARGNLADALAAITARQRARISRTAEIFLQRNPALANCDLRFDAVLIVPGRAPRHVIDAWRGGDRAVNT